MSEMTFQCEWISVSDDLPDDDTEVIIAMKDGDVSHGFRDAGCWRYASAEQVASPVTHWTEMLEHPSMNGEEAQSHD